MSWQLCDPTFRQAIVSVVELLKGNCALAGTVGVQIHVASALGLDKRGPPARAIELVTFDATPPACVGAIPVVVVDPLGFEASVAAERRIVAIDGAELPVASPEHILGMRLATPSLPPDAKWACFLLMRICGDLDLEQARAFLKRCASPEEQQSLLAELAYLAA